MLSNGDHWVEMTDGTRLRCRIDGPENAPAIMFAHSLLCDSSMWDKQIAAMSETWRCIRWDQRGHGQSDAGTQGGSIALLASDALGIMDAAGVQRASWVGLSIGGAIGLHLASQASARLDRYVICNTAPHFPPADRWNTRIAVTQADGIEGVARASIERWVTPEFVATMPEKFKTLLAVAAQTAPQGYRVLAEALRDVDLRDSLGEIQSPCLIVASNEDVATVAQVRSWAGAIPGVRVAVLEAAGHLSNIEQPAAFTDLLQNFLQANH